MAVKRTDRRVGAARPPGSAAAVAVAAIGAGALAVVVQSATGYLVMAADAATPSRLAFYLRHTSGVLAVALTAERADALALPALSAETRPGDLAAPTVPVDLATSADRGSSAADRAATIAALADPDSMPGQFVTPGHVFPLRLSGMRIVSQQDPAQAALDLARLAGRSPAGVLAPILCENGEVARGEELADFALSQGLPIIEIDELIRYRMQERPATHVTRIRLPTPHGDFACHAWEMPEGTVHLALTRAGFIPSGPLRAIVHRECRAGEVFRRRGCDCYDELQRAQQALSAAATDVLIYLRAPETADELACSRVSARDGRARPIAARSLAPGEATVYAQILAELPDHVDRPSPPQGATGSIASRM